MSWKYAMLMNLDVPQEVQQQWYTMIYAIPSIVAK